ncbi:MAG: PAM68 family protein [Synechococcus sp.]|nr:PAM68 family protein [Synechococcus sp.]
MSTAPGFAAPRLAAATTRGRARPADRPARRQLGIPDSVANRMARRIAIATGIPTLMGMGVFVASYLLVSRNILDIAPAATLTASGACFLLGLLGLSYGVLSSSWEEAPGTLLGGEQIGLNLGRVRASIRAMQQSGNGNSAG